jgi:hypothetical protein
MGVGIRGILTLVALLIAVALERLATYGARSLYTSQIIANDSAASFGRIFPVITVLSIVGLFLATGITALVRNARITFVIGSLFGVLASVLFLTLDSPKVGAFVLAIAAGMIRVCPYVIAGEILGEEPSTTKPSSHLLQPAPFRVAAVAAFVMAIVFVSQGAGSISGAFFHVSHLDGAAAFTNRYLVVVGLMISTLLFAGGVLLIHFVGRGSQAGNSADVHDPYRAPAPAPAPDPDPQPSAWGHRWLTGLAILVWPVAVLTLTSDFGRVGQNMMRDQGMTFATFSMFLMVESGIAAFAALLFAVFFLVMGITRGRIPPLYFFGVALVLTGLGTIVKAIGGIVPVYVLGSILDGLASPVSVIGVAYAVTALRGNSRSMLVLAFWNTTLMQTSLSAAPVAAVLGSRLPAFAIGVLAIAGGAIFLPLMKKIQAQYFTPPQQPQQP